MLSRKVKCSQTGTDTTAAFAFVAVVAKQGASRRALTRLQRKQRLDMLQQVEYDN